jgi:hypothetical protein
VGKAGVLSCRVFDYRLFGPNQRGRLDRTKKVNASVALYISFENFELEIKNDLDSEVVKEVFSQVKSNISID